MPIAPRTFHAWAVRAPSKRSLWDATITEVLAGYYEPDEHGRRKPESLYGSLKMWAHLQREGIPVAKSTVERLMRRHGWQGVRRQKSVRTTIADPTVVRPPDLVDRQYGVSAPNRLLVADFTYVKLITGVFVYVAFVIDAYSRRILGWRAATSMRTALVLDTLEQALWARRRDGRGSLAGLVHHTDAGSQGGFNRSSQHLSRDCDDTSEETFGSGWPGGVSIAWSSYRGSTRRTSDVLGVDCGGPHERGRCYRRRRFPGGRRSVVPESWRHGAFAFVGKRQAAFRPVLIICGA